MALPSIAFAIPPVLEIDAGAGALLTVPTFDQEPFVAALLRLAESPAERHALGERGRRRVAERFLVKENMREVLIRLAALPGLCIKPRNSALAEVTRFST